MAHELLPQVILCDSCMPSRNGLEVIAALRAAADTAPIPIILMSGYQRTRFDGCGADVFLPKPFLMSEMVTLVQTMTARRDPRPQPAFAA